MAQSTRIIVIFGFSQMLFSDAVLRKRRACLGGGGGKIYLCLRFSNGLMQRVCLAKNSEPGVVLLGGDV